MARVQAQWWRFALVASSGAAPSSARLQLFMPTRLDRGAVGFYLALSGRSVVAIKPARRTLPATALALIVAGWADLLAGWAVLRTGAA